MDTPSAKKSLLRRQQISSSCTYVSSKALKYPTDVRKECPKNRKSSSFAELSSQLTKSEENSLLRLETNQTKNLDRNSAEEDKVPVEKGEHFDIRDVFKSHASQRKSKKLMNGSKHKISSNFVMKSNRVNSLVKQKNENNDETEVLKEAVNETLSIAETSHADRKSFSHTLTSQSKNNKEHKSDSAHILFSKIKTPKRETQKVDGGSSFIPESQEDKLDDMFSPKFRKKKRKSASFTLKRRGKMITVCSAYSVKNTKTFTGTERNTNGNSSPVTSGIKVITSHSKEDLATNKQDGGGAVASDVTDVDTKQNCDISLSHTPVSNGVMKRIASSTPLITPEAQSSKSPALSLTPGSDIATSVLNLMMNSGLNNSSDLFNETDLQDIQENQKNSKEVSEISYDMQSKKCNSSHSSDDDSFNKKKARCRREHQEMTNNSNRIHVNTSQQNNKTRNVTNSECQKLKSPTNLEKRYNYHKVAVSEVPTDFPNDVSQKNDCLHKINDLKFHESFQNKLEEEFLLTESQKNGLMMTMTSQDSLYQSRETDCQRDLDNILKESDDSDCNKSSTGYHKKTDKLNRKNDIMETNDSEAGKKRKLQQDTDLYVPSKRMCALHEENSSKLLCKVDSVNESIKHVTLKTNNMNIPIRKAQKANEEPRSFSYLENLTCMSDICVDDVEGKEALDGSFSESTDKDVLNQAIQDVSELGYKSNNSLFSEENEEPHSKRFNLKEGYKAVSDFEKHDKGSPKDFCVSESFLEQAFGSWPQDDAEPQNEDSQPVGKETSVLFFPNDTKNLESEKEKRDNKIQQPQRARNSVNCEAAPLKPQEREEAQVKSGKSSVTTSSECLNDTFSQLEITPQTEALLEGKFATNNHQKRLSEDLFCSPTESSEKLQKKHIKIMKKESTRVCEDKICNNTSNSVKEIITVPVATIKGDETGYSILRSNVSEKHHVDDVRNTDMRIVSHGNSGHSISQGEAAGLENMQEQKHGANSANVLSSTVSDSLPNTSSFCIIDVVNEYCVFASFLEELKQQSVVSVALACESAPSQKQKQELGIGEIFSSFMHNMMRR